MQSNTLEERCLAAHHMDALFHRIRPDVPRPDAQKPGKVIKYDQPAGVPVALDVPLLAHEDLLDRTRMLWIVEGEKKADTLVSRGECAVANYQVRLAEDALAKALEGRMGYVG